MKGKEILSLRRLTQHKNKAGDITSALAWDDLTGMRLDAGKVVEARNKEVTYIRDEGLRQYPETSGHEEQVEDHKDQMD